MLTGICRFFAVLSLCLSPSFGLLAAQIRVVGSATVFPFISSIAEEFGRFSSFSTPVIESVGSGMGFNMFCAGAKKSTPDIVMSSRRIKDAEVALCAANGVHDPVEVMIGYDGIVVASSRQRQILDFRFRDLFNALSKYSLSNEYGDIALNNYSKWSEIRPDLPESEVEIYGPHKNAGTYDILIDYVIRDMCIGAKSFINLYADLEERKSVCGNIRNDGKYIEVATSENVIIQKIAKNGNAFGILSFSYLVKHQNEIQGNKIAGVEPTYDNIVSGKYVLSRPMYIYVKREHLGNVEGLKEFVKEVMKTESVGSNGYLINLGFIPMSDEQLSKVRQNVERLIS
ncbi:substrate-binding domain-containing protein [Anaplasma bovis]|uniref:substrate-binding domain-containing protein n=1 Tax=Anaplasma bovis TaxID=186733 RepID=UPI002FF1EC0D